MKLYRISQTVNSGYDTYDSAVVAAESEEDARHMQPSGAVPADYDGEVFPIDKADDDAFLATWCEEHFCSRVFDGWAQPKHVKVEYLGETQRPRGVVCASFNAG